MKFALHLHTQDDIANMYEMVKKASPPYEMIEYDEDKNLKFEPYKEYEWLKSNFFEIYPVELGSLKPVLTTEGICQAWLPFDIENPFSRNDFIDLFEEVFNKSAKQVTDKNSRTIRFIGYESNYISNIKEANYR